MGYQEYTSLHKIIIGILCCSTNKYRTEKESVKDNEMSDMVNVRKYHIKSSSKSGGLTMQYNQ
jgi:coenzyme F420-reducing hydrogenase beta subunit